MSIKALIIDDEERGIVALAQLVEKYCKDVIVEGTAMNVADAETLIKSRLPDVVFLDIEMPGGNGFQLLEKFEEVNFEIIFVTAYHEYAIKAIRFSALDYLLKPVKITDLQSAIERIRKRRGNGSGDSEKYRFFKSIINEPNPFKKIILSTMDGYFPIRFEEIIYCRADDSYTHFYLSGNKHHVVSRHLKEFEEMLVPHHFYRIHKSYLVNLNHIERIGKADGFTVFMSNNDELPVSFRKKEEFISLIKKLA
jgi:two-component system, LytTR family, response regulator